MQQSNASVSIASHTPRRSASQRLPELPATLAHLRNESRWVLWKYDTRITNGKGKHPKAPYTPHKQPTPEKPKGTYRRAKTDDATTWGTYDQCLAAMRDYTNRNSCWFDGIGIMLLNGDVGIDFDECYAADDTLRADVAQFVELAAGRAYIERSVSGQGVHIITLGTTGDAIKTDAGEVYAGGTGRYFTLSGDELPGSARPADGQCVIDAVIAQLAPTRRQQPASVPTMPVTLALTSELADDIKQAQRRLPALLNDLQRNTTSQLRDLLERGIFPAGMNRTTASDARAVVVAQIQRAANSRGKRRNFTDGEVVVLARHIWHLKAYEGAMQSDNKRLNADVYRLIALYRPQRKGQQTVAPTPKRTYQAAPAPLAYLQRLADARVGDAIPANRTERAKLAGVSLITAKRIEEQLQIRGLATTETYSLRGQGTKGRSSLLRFTPAGLAALRNEPVISSANVHVPHNEPVEKSAAECGNNDTLESKNTGVCDTAPIAGLSPSALSALPLPGAPPAGRAARQAHEHTPPPPRVPSRSPTELQAAEAAMWTDALAGAEAYLIGERERLARNVARDMSVPLMVIDSLLASIDVPNDMPSPDQWPAIVPDPTPPEPCAIVELVPDAAFQRAAMIARLEALKALRMSTVSSV